MPFIGERLTVKNIPDALSRLKQIRGAKEVRQLGPSPFAGMPGGIVASGTVLTVRSNPTFEELQLLTRQGINLCLQFACQDGQPVLDLIPGGRDEMIIPESAYRDALTLAFHNEIKYSLADPAAVFSIITADNAVTWGLRDFWHILTPDFVFRIENLSNQDGITDVRGEGSSSFLQVRVFRQPLPGPFERGFPYRGNEQYEEPAAFYSQVVSAIAGNNFLTSFAVSGLPRIGKATAKARLYFFTWDDFAVMLKELYRGDTFRVFNSGDSWLNFFAR